MAANQPVQISHTYQPQFFSAEQYKALDTLTEAIIPRDATPGARDAGVAEFIDFMVKSDVALQQPFLQGLQALDRLAAPATFLALSHQGQVDLLTRLAYKNKFRPGEEPAQQFFKLARQYTVIGYYTTRIGLEAIDYPGLKFYATSPGCTHPDNPEHAGLTAAGENHA